MKQHTLPIDTSELHLVPLYPPRRRVWDWLPVWFCELYLKLGIHSPKPTPREEWIISSVLLRAKYKGLMTVLLELQETPRVYSYQSWTPDKKKVNPEDLN